jgi:hypothetical protein
MARSRRTKPERASDSSIGGHLLLAILVVALVWCATIARADEVIPTEFHGDWAPKAEGCESKTKFRVAGDTLTLVNGRDSEAYGNVAIAHSFFGPAYEGISVVAIPEFDSGAQPFTVFFNSEEQRGVTRVEIYREMKGVTNPAVLAIQEKAKKLAERFPVNDIPLAKCPGGS